MASSSTSSLWSRFLKRGANWGRYEYPEAHRHPPPPRSTTTTTTTSPTGGVLDPDDLFPLDHPYHRTTNNSKMNSTMRSLAKVVLWSAVHVGTMYVIRKYLKPWFYQRYPSLKLDGDDDENDEDDCIKKPFWKRWNKKKKQDQRMCCCCEAMVSSKDKYCPKCGQATCPLCIYCGNAIQNDDNYCNSCGNPVPDQVIVDGGSNNTIPTAPSAPPMPSVTTATRRTSSSSVTSSLRTPTSPDGRIQSSQQAVGPPPFVEGTLPPFAAQQQQPKEEASVATAESVPIVQADGLVPLVPAMYVEEVTAIASPDAQPQFVVASSPPQEGQTVAAAAAAVQGHPQQQQQQQHQHYDEREEAASTEDGLQPQQQQQRQQLNVQQDQEQRAISAAAAASVVHSELVNGDAGNGEGKPANKQQ